MGTAYVANQKPDGYNILVTTPNLYLVVEKNKAQNVEQPYKLEQIQPIALTSADPLIFVVQTESPYKSIKEFIADAKAKDGQLAYSSSGPFGVTHVPFAMFTQSTGLKMRHVPTTGGGPAVTQLLGGHVQATGQGLAAVAPHIKGGKLRPLASWGAKRHANLPDVATFKELGYDLEAYLWVGLFTTAGVPEPTFKAMRDLVRRTINDPTVPAGDAESERRDRLPRHARIREVLPGRLQAARPRGPALAQEEKKSKKTRRGAQRRKDMKIKRIEPIAVSLPMTKPIKMAGVELSAPTTCSCASRPTTASSAGAKRRRRRP